MNEVKLSIIRSDYYSALADYGISHQKAQEQTKNQDDLIIDDIDGISVKKSVIDGVGIFSENVFKSGDFICIAKTNGKRTIAGRYTNHSPIQNAAFVFADGDIILIAMSDININDEITIDYRAALSLQISRPDLVGNLISLNDGLALSDKARCFLYGADAAAYDLLFNEDHICNLSMRERVLAFEEVLAKLPQTHIEPTHEFIDGLYRREITFKKGTLATGKIHKKDHMDVILSGEMLVATDGGFEYIKGPCFRTSIAGKKKAGYALTDVVWATYHPTEAKTVEDIEKELFMDDFDEINIPFHVVEVK